MPIHYEHTLDVSSRPDQAFAVLDDVTQTPKWLARCTGIEKMSPGPNAVGTKLRYSYKDTGRVGVMEGEITERTPNERLTMHYTDKMMDVTVHFRMEPAGGGARLTHAIDITPRNFFAKLFSPLIRRQLPKQTVAAMESLKALVEKN